METFHRERTKWVRRFLQCLGVLIYTSLPFLVVQTRLIACSAPVVRIFAQIPGAIEQQAGWPGTRWTANIYTEYKHKYANSNVATYTNNAIIEQR